jgi:hypothetical protein
MVMASLLSSVMLAREHIGFGLVPHRMIAGGQVADVGHPDERQQVVLV